MHASLTALGLAFLAPLPLRAQSDVQFWPALSVSVDLPSRLVLNTDLIVMQTDDAFVGLRLAVSRRVALEPGYLNQTFFDPGMNRVRHVGALFVVVRP